MASVWPSCTVIIPVYNGEQFIGDAIESAMSQTLQPDEIVVVDDGSTDGTAAIVRRFPGVTLISQENSGPAAARNTGIRHATGDLVAMLDADDMWPADRQEIMVRHMVEHAETDLVLGQQQLLIEPGAVLPHWVPADYAPSWKPGRLKLPVSAFVARRGLFSLVGFMDETLRHGEDTEWHLRVRDAGLTITVLPDVVLIRRIHGSNLTLDAESQRQAVFDVLARRMKHRRGGAGGEAPEPVRHDPTEP